jgi:hypothetical protein
MAAKLENIDTMNTNYESAKQHICDKTIHVFPFLLIPSDSGANQYGCYTSYIPCGIYICKLFDYHTLSTHYQCTLEEIESKKCNDYYSYIGERYDHLFPFEEALITYRNSCILPITRASPRASKSDSYSGEGIFKSVDSNHRSSSGRKSDEMITIKFSGGKTKKINKYSHFRKKKLHKSFHKNKNQKK